MKRKSKTQESIDRELKRAYEVIALTRDHSCEGCGNTSNLTHAHLIRRSWRRDLVTDLDNIRYMCITCHTIYDDYPLLRDTLDNYEDWLEYIKEKDSIYYNKMIAKNG
jgi:hypothetical protein